MAAASREGWMEFETVETLTKGRKCRCRPVSPSATRTATSATGCASAGGTRAPRPTGSSRSCPTTCGTICRTTRCRARRTAAMARETGVLRPLLDDRRPAAAEPDVACVDYSAGNGGDLVAYRWEGEPTLDVSHFFSARDA